MVDPDLPPPPQLVGGVIGTVRLHDDLVKKFSAWFRVTKEDGWTMSSEKRSGREFHSLLSHMASGMDPVPGFKRVALLQVEPDGTVHILHSLFSVPVSLYSTSCCLFV